MCSTGSKQHAVSIVRIDERRVELLGKLQRFRDQGECICNIANSVLFQGKAEESKHYYQKARDLGAAHGFFSVECTSCMGLAQLAIRDGKTEDAVPLLQNALAATPLLEGGESVGACEELMALKMLTDTLLETNSVDEVETLVERYRSAVRRGTAEHRDRVVPFELHSLYVSARLHEVLCISIPFRKTTCCCSALALHHGR